MYKPEVTEELSVGGRVQPILSFAINEFLKLGCKLESLGSIKYTDAWVLYPEILITQPGLRVGVVKAENYCFEGRCQRSLPSMGCLLGYQKFTQADGNV